MQIEQEQFKLLSDIYKRTLQIQQKMLVVMTAVSKLFTPLIESLIRAIVCECHLMQLVGGIIGLSVVPEI